MFPQGALEPGAAGAGFVDEDELLTLRAQLPKQLVDIALPCADSAEGDDLRNLFSRQAEKYYRQLEANLRQDILVKRDALVDKNINVAADDENVQPLLKFFESKFRWLSGEYELTLKVQVEPERASLSRGYRMTLFESDSKELTDYRDDYKYGFGVCLDLQRHVGVIVPLTEA